MANAHLKMHLPWQIQTKKRCFLVRWCLRCLTDGTWAPGVRRAVWARGVRTVVQFGVESSVMYPVLGQAMWRMGR